MSNASISDGSIPSTLADPPASSPPSYVVWVNSLWLLALLISLSGAVFATIEKHCVLQHVATTQNKYYTPEMRARVHARFSNHFGFWGNSAILFCLHLSFFLFIVGVLVYLFNINRATFLAVVWCFAIVTFLYMGATAVPIFLPNELLFTPLSVLVLRAFRLSSRELSRLFCFMCPVSGPFATMNRYYIQRSRYNEGLLGGKIKSVEDTALEPSSSIDTKILEKIVFTLNGTDALEKFFDAIPGFCGSCLVEKPLNDRVVFNLRISLISFLGRTFSSHFAAETDRTNRIITYLNAAHSILDLSTVAQILENIFKAHWDKVSKSVDIREWLRRWARHSNHLDPNLRRVAACIITCAKDGDDKWTEIAEQILRVPKYVFLNCRLNTDSTLFAILIHVAGEAFHTNHLEQGVLESLSLFDVRNTPLQLQHNFCTLWYEIVQKASTTFLSEFSLGFAVFLSHYTWTPIPRRPPLTFTPKTPTLF
jgi:hypothetical protein